MRSQLFQVSYKSLLTKDFKFFIRILLSDATPQESVSQDDGSVTTYQIVKTFLTKKTVQLVRVPSLSLNAMMVFALRDP